MLWCINSFNSLTSRSVQTVLVYCHLILKVFRRTLHEHSVTSSFRSLQGGQEIAGPALTWQSLIGRRVITARSWVKPKRLRTVGRGGWHSFSVYIFACFFLFRPETNNAIFGRTFSCVLSSWYLPNLLSMNESSVTKRCCYVSSRFLSGYTEILWLS